MLDPMLMLSPRCFWTLIFVFSLIVTILRSLSISINTSSMLLKIRFRASSWESGVFEERSISTGWFFIKCFLYRATKGIFKITYLPFREYDFRYESYQN